MKRELCAGALLLLMALCAFWNLRRIEMLADGINADIGLAEIAIREGDFESALNSVRSGRTKWEDSRAVNSAFLSRDDIDRVDEAFLEEERALLSADAVDALSAGGALRRHLENLVQGQRPCAESVL